VLQIEISVKGRLDEDWSTWFDGFEISYSDQGETVLRGCLTDQTALYGMLAKLRDLGLSLVSVKQSGSEQASDKENNYGKSE